MFGFFERQLEKMGYSIRPVQAHELEALRKVAEQSFRETYAADISVTAPAIVEDWIAKIYSDAALNDWVTNPANRLLGVFNKDGALQGFSLLCLEGATARLDKLYLLSSVQGIGLGRLLLEANYSELRKHPAVSALSLEVADSNVRARGFYQRMGLASTSTQVEFSGSSSENPLFNSVYRRDKNSCSAGIDEALSRLDEKAAPSMSSQC
ncbi:putative acetyltransferase [Legionella geestiana]|uniref:Putative acetyltransferase n=1 Tax=Legionella geestiana TaxID=45065 RepID=A0A0W0TT64_9GAMM|nr:GNAT family N-acetyltransferase [Legionella geestiana]KTC98839.1 putative acetyltransferase [Legionella geestiana]QBS12768.1 GNAT family N-acetyltransferase [Legionella geestiana]QDQ39515.1 GNAT family N-acetyltransferase [Legionella geestiana]STX54757.1 putative acetyltransferase [Legionella geestiana]